MKTIILAGGLGTRISEETGNKPKPMVLIDDKPLIWHVMSIYAKQGFSDFIIAGGYKINVIQEWASSLITPWKIDVVDTGEFNQTGSRILQAMKYVGNERVFVTYGDGLGNINLHELLQFHINNSRLATVTPVRPPARFGVLESVNGIVTHFGEKNQADSGWINGGFFVLEPQISTFPISGSTSFESDVLPQIVQSESLAAYHHGGFWQPMDTLREKNILSELVMRRTPPWLEI